jgi:hypothetical protein
VGELVTESLFPFEMPEFLGFVGEPPVAPEQQIIFPPTRSLFGVAESLVAPLGVVTSSAVMLKPQRDAGIRAFGTASKRKASAASAILDRRPRAKISRERAAAEISHGTSAGLIVKGCQSAMKVFERAGNLVVHASDSALRKSKSGSSLIGRKTGSSLTSFSASAKMY